MKRPVARLNKQYTSTRNNNNNNNNNKLTSKITTTMKVCSPIHGSVRCTLGFLHPHVPVCHSVVSHIPSSSIHPSFFLFPLVSILGLCPSVCFVAYQCNFYLQLLVNIFSPTFITALIEWKFISIKIQTLFGSVKNLKWFKAILFPFSAKATRVTWRHDRVDSGLPSSSRMGKPTCQIHVLMHICRNYSRMVETVALTFRNLASHI